VSLYVWGNNIGAVAAKAIEGMRTGSRIQTLQLDRNHRRLTEEWARAFASGEDADYRRSTIQRYLGQIDCIESILRGSSCTNASFGLEKPSPHISLTL
jgi:hypothetical protein